MESSLENELKDNIYINNKKIRNAVTIDIAALCMEYTKLEKTCDHETIDLDDIYINKSRFKNLFYPQGETFGLDKKIATREENVYYISLSHKERTIEGKTFYLLESIIRVLENTLNVTRHCFTSDTMVELTNELGSIKNLCDIPCCSVVASVPWSILNETMNINKELNKNGEPLVFHCRITVTFKTPTVGVPPISLRINYIVVE